MRRDISTQQSQQTVENISQFGTTFRFEQAHQVFSSILLSNSFYVIAVLLFSFEMNFEGNMLSVIYCVDSKLLLQLIHQLYYYRTFLQFNIQTCFNKTNINFSRRFLFTCTQFILDIVINYFILFNCYFILKIKQIEFNRKRQAFQKRNQIFVNFNLYKNQVNIYLNTVSGTRNLLLFSNILPLFNIFLCMIEKINEGSQYFKGSISFINIFHVFRNITLLIISIFLSLKLEGQFEIQWLYALWMFWILFGVSTIIVIYCIFLILGLGIQIILEQNSRLKNLVIVNFWILLFMTSNAFMFLLIPISILNFYNIGNYGNIVNITRIILIVNQIIFSYFTVRFKPEVVLSLQTYLSLNDSVNPLNTLPTQQSEEQLQQYKKQGQTNSQVIEPHMQIPKVVKRISKTYFGFDDLPSDKILEIQHPVKKPSHHKAQSSQIQRHSQNENENENIKLTSLINIRINEQQSNTQLENISKEIDQVNLPGSVSLSSINACCICFDNEPNALFMQCGHGGVCYNCAIDLWKNKEECYLCRNKIERVLKINMNEQQNNIYQVVAATDLNQKLKFEQKNLTQNQQQ